MNEWPKTSGSQVASVGGTATGGGDRAPTLSIVTPAYAEAENLPLLYQRLCQVLDVDGQPVTWEWVVVDDHSPDDTFAVVGKLASQDARVRGYRLARNAGSHMAITCGLHQARGQAAVIMAADLQAPQRRYPI